MGGEMESTYGTPYPPFPHPTKDTNNNGYGNTLLGGGYRNSKSHRRYNKHYSNKHKLNYFHLDLVDHKHFANIDKNKSCTK